MTYFFFSVSGDMHSQMLVRVVTRTFHDHLIVAHIQLQEEKHFPFMLLDLMSVPAPTHIHLMGVYPYHSD